MFRGGGHGAVPKRSPGLPGQRLFFQKKSTGTDHSISGPFIQLSHDSPCSGIPGRVKQPIFCSFPDQRSFRLLRMIGKTELLPFPRVDELLLSCMQNELKSILNRRKMPFCSPVFRISADFGFCCDYINVREIPDSLFSYNTLTF